MSPRPDISEISDSKFMELLVNGGNRKGCIHFPTSSDNAVRVTRLLAVEEGEELDGRAEVVPVRDVVGCVVSAIMFPPLHFLSNYSFYSFL